MKAEFRPNAGTLSGQKVQFVPGTKTCEAKGVRGIMGLASAETAPRLNVLRRKSRRVIDHSPLSSKSFLECRGWSRDDGSSLDYHSPSNGTSLASCAEMASSDQGRSCSPNTLRLMPSIRSLPTFTLLRETLPPE